MNQWELKHLPLENPLVVELEVLAVLIQIDIREPKIPLIQWHVFRVQLAQTADRERGCDLAIHVCF